MNTLHLFAGAGGGIIADMMLGHTPVGAVEIDPFCRKVLQMRQDEGWLPKFPIFEDVKDFNGNEIQERVDCVCGGFPCQDISSAGCGGGITGARSGLFFELTRICRNIRPRYIFLENSPFIISRGLDAVLCEIAEMGYDAEWCCLSAADVGAWHGRERWWCLCKDRERERESNNDVRIMFPTINTSGKGGGSHIFARINPLRDSGAITQEEWEAFGGYEYSEKSNAHKEYTKKEEHTLFPTPTVRDCHSVGPSDMDRRSPKLDTVVTMIPTPTSRDWKGQGEPGREEVKKMAKEFSESERCVYPTPRTTGLANGTTGPVMIDKLYQEGRLNEEERTAMRRGWPGGKLNPAWVEWLMGWPIGWTALKPLETVRFPLAPPQRS